MKRLYFTLTLLLLSSLACSLGKQPPAAPVEPPSQPPASAVPPTPTAAATTQCQNPYYYPVVEGASWNYQLSDASGSNSTFTRTITAVREDGFDEQDVFSVGTTRQGSWACQNGNLTALTPTFGASVSATDMQFNFTIESNSGISFPANPQPGQGWSQNIVYSTTQNLNNLNMEARVTAQIDCQAIGMEKVSTPAGEFDALRVDCSTRMDVSMSGSPAITISDNSSAWYAQGIGMVKSSSVSNMGNTEITLLSYNIP